MVIQYGIGDDGAAALITVDAKVPAKISYKTEFVQ